MGQDEGWICELETKDARRLARQIGRSAFRLMALLSFPLLNGLFCLALTLHYPRSFNPSEFADFMIFIAKIVSSSWSS